MGPFLMTTSAVLFAIMNYAVKVAAGGLPGSEVAFFRFTFGGALVGLLWGASWVARRAGWRGEGVWPSWRRWRLIAARGLLGGVAILLLYLAMGAGSLTNTAVISNTYPAFATVFAIWLLHEKPGPLVWSALLVCTVGVVLMVGGQVGVGRGDLLALASSVFSGIAVVVVRALRKTESTWSVFASLCVFGSLVTAVYGGQHFVAVQRSLWPALGVASATGFLAQVTMTAGFRYCTTSVGSILSMTSVVFSGVLGYAFLGDRLTAVELIGAVLMIGGSVVAGLGRPSSSPDVQQTDADEALAQPR